MLVQDAREACDKCNALCQALTPCTLNRSTLNHSTLNHSTLNHSTLNHSTLNHSTLNPIAGGRRGLDIDIDIDRVANNTHISNQTRKTIVQNKQTNTHTHTHTHIHKGSTRGLER